MSQAGGRVPCRILHWILALSLALAPRAAGQNLLLNGTFDVGLASWTTHGDVSFSGEDAGGSPSSGSARLAAVAPATAVFDQCVELPNGVTSLQLDLALRVVDPPPAGFVGVRFDFAFAPACAGSPAIRVMPVPTGAAGAWTPVAKAVPVPPGAKSVKVVLGASVNAPTGAIEAYLDDLRLEPIAAFLLNQDRFLVSADWETDDGRAGHAVGVELAADSGYFWFFDPTNVELIVKVLDGCAINDRFWVFAGGLTNVRVTLRVLDTTFGFEQAYVNPQSTAFQPLLDTDALNACF